MCKATTPSRCNGGQRQHQLSSGLELYSPYSNAPAPRRRPSFLPPPYPPTHLHLDGGEVSRHGFAAAAQLAYERVALRRVRTHRVERLAQCLHSFGRGSKLVEAEAAARVSPRKRTAPRSAASALAATASAVASSRAADRLSTSADAAARAAEASLSAASALWRAASSADSSSAARDLDAAEAATASLRASSSAAVSSRRRASAASRRCCDVPRAV